MRHLRGLFHPASMLSVAALIVGLGSTAFAAGMITGADIKDGTVTTADIRDGTLRTRDLSEATVDRLRGQAGPVGPAGAQGPPGVAGYEIVTGQRAVPAGTVALLSKDCPAGKKALSADAYWGHHTDAVSVGLYANGGGAAAFIRGLAVDDNLHLEVVCATAG